MHAVVDCIRKCIDCINYNFCTFISLSMTESRQRHPKIGFLRKYLYNFPFVLENDISLLFKQKRKQNF